MTNDKKANNVYLIHPKYVSFSNCLLTPLFHKIFFAQNSLFSTKIIAHTVLVGYICITHYETQHANKLNEVIGYKIITQPLNQSRIQDKKVKIQDMKIIFRFSQYIYYANLFSNFLGESSTFAI